MVDALGNMVWSAQYSAFGKAHVVVDTVENNLRFPGQYFDVETGLHQNYFRYYDPNVARYIEKDPIGLIAGLNTYSYVDNNPLVFVDLKGLNKSAASASNPWHQFRRGVKGRGYDNAQLSFLYRKYQLAKLARPRNPELDYWLDKLSTPSTSVIREELKTIRCNSHGVCSIEVEKCSCQKDNDNNCSLYNTGPQMRPMANQDPSCKCRTETIRFMKD